MMLLIKWHFEAVFFVHITMIISMVVGLSYRECNGDDKTQKFVVSYDNCAKYIYCDADNSFDGECLGDYYFNVNEGKCDERSAVVCSIDEQSNEKSQGSTDSQSSLVSQGSEVLTLDGGRVEQNFTNTNSIKNTNYKDHHNTNNTNNNNHINKYNYLTNTMTGEQQVKNQPPKSSALGEVVTGLALSAIDMGYTGGSIATFAQPPRCPVRYGTQSISYLANIQSCSSYYICYNGIAIPMICPQNTYFNQAISRCERQVSPYCPYDRQVRLVCNPGVYDYIPHSRNCSYYYYCSNGYLIILQCPPHFTWHYERRSCVHRSQAKCFTRAIAQTLMFG